MRIGIPAETRDGETRVAATAETIKKLTGSGHQVLVERGAGTAASQIDAALEAAGAALVGADEALAAEMVLKVRAPQPAELAKMTPGAVLVGMLNPFDRDGLQAMAQAGLTAFALEAAPRTTRAQSMDVLSSQANIAGYKAVLLAASAYGRMMPMLMTAAGTIKAARVVAWFSGRDYLTPEDIRAVLPSTLVHRVFFTPVYELRRAELADALVAQMLDRVATP